MDTDTSNATLPLTDPDAAPIVILWGSAAPQIMEVDGLFHAPVPLEASAIGRWSSAPMTPFLPPARRWMVMGFLAALADLLAQAWRPALAPLVHPWLTLRAIAVTAGPTASVWWLWAHNPSIRTIVVHAGPVVWLAEIGITVAMVLVWGTAAAAAVAMGRAIARHRHAWAARGERAWLR